MFVVKRNGNEEEVHFDKIVERISKLINKGEEKYVNAFLVGQKVIASIFSGITTEELDKESAKICSELSTTHPLYSDLGGRILVSNLQKKTTEYYERCNESGQRLKKIRRTFSEKTELINNIGILDNDYYNFVQENSKKLNKMIDYTRDYFFDFFGFKTLERAYLIRNQKTNEIYECPQDMLLRVSIFICQGDMKEIKKTYDLLSNGFYIHATPTLFNSGTKLSQLSSCFLISSEDSMEGITDTIASTCKISKNSGGIGLEINNIRPEGSIIRGTNGPSSGIVPMLKVYNDIANYVNQCFIGETMIATERGYKFIKDLKPKDRVITSNGRPCEINRVLEDVYSGKFCKITMNNGESVDCTESHSFCVIKNSSLINIGEKIQRKLVNYEWCDANNLTEDDLLIIPVPQNVNDNTNITELDCYIYGLIIGNVAIDNNIISIKTTLTSNGPIKEYLTRHLIDYNEGEGFLTFLVTSRFKFSQTQLLNFDMNMLMLPFSKLIGMLNGLYCNIGKCSSDMIYFIGDPYLLYNIKYILLRLGSIGTIEKDIEDKTYYLSCPLSRILSEMTGMIYVGSSDCVFYDNKIIVKIKSISYYEKENVQVYDLEINNNKNYLTLCGLVHNGGKRKGSIAVYLEPHHSDIFEFLELRNNVGVEEMRARDLFTALWISDTFMKQVENDGDWYLMCPDECKGLTETYGDEFEKLYWSYVEKGMYRKKVKAKDLVKAIFTSQNETGTPYILYKDSINKKSNQKNIGTITSSNLCVSGDTELCTDKGVFKIKDLKDQEVTLWNGYEYSTTTIRQTGKNQEMMKITFTNDEEIKCTPYHKFFIQTTSTKFEDAIQIEAQNLELGMKLPTYYYPTGNEIMNLQVTNIESSDNEDTYCLTEPKRNSVFFNCILTGNCAEIVEYHDSENHAVCNLGSIALNRMCVPFDNQDKSYTVYTKKDCNFCKWSKNWLYTKGYDYNEILCDTKETIDYVKNKVGKDKITFPQIFREDEYIGGFEELVKYHAYTYNYDLLYEVAYQATINLNKVIDINYYPTFQTRRSNMKTRPIGLGIQGLADTLVLMKIPFESDEANQLNAKIMETIYFAAVNASCDMAKQRSKHMVNFLKYHSKTNYTIPEVYDKNLQSYDEEYIRLYHLARPDDKSIKIYLMKSNNMTTKRKKNMEEFLKLNEKLGYKVQEFYDDSLCTYDDEYIKLYHLAKPNDMDIENLKENPSCYGAYSYYHGSPMSQGLFQHNLGSGDSHLWSDDEKKLFWDWNGLRERVKEHGVLNSLLVALMPTASTSQILGNNECFEFFTSNIYTRSTLSGSFSVVNKYLVNDLINIGEWNNDCKQEIVKARGSVQTLNNIPKIFKDLYKIQFELKQKAVLNQARARSPFVDQTQSMNIFLKNPNYQVSYSVMMTGWKYGLKTGSYYIRTPPGSYAKQITVSNNEKDTENEILDRELETCEMCSA